MNTPKCVIFDGHSLMFRAFYALPPMTTIDGLHTNAIHGFLNMMFKCLKDESPTHVVVAFDLKGPTFRNDKFSDYKANRKPTPHELSEQVINIKSLLYSMNISVVASEGHEGDDVIGTIASIAKDNSIDVVIVTGDRDALQLVDDGIEVALTKRGISYIERYDVKRIEDEYGMEPKALIEVKGLMGDSSDNIPGVPGIGEKTALKLISQFGTIENMYGKMDELKASKMKDRLIEFKDQALISKWLGTIKCDIDLDITVDELLFSLPTPKSIKDEFNKFELKTAYKNMLSMANMINNNNDDGNNEDFATADSVDITDIDTLKTVIDLVKKEKKIAITLWPNLTISVNDKLYYRVVETHTLLEPGIDHKMMFGLLDSVLGDESIKKTMFDYKTMEHSLNKQGIAIKGCIIDLMIASYLLEPTRTINDIKTLSQMFIDEDREDAAVLYTIENIAMPKIEKDGMKSLYFDVEMPLACVLKDMEDYGFCVDIELLKQLKEKFDATLSDITEKVYGLAGQEFNINSPKQLGEVLFDKLGLKYVKKTKTGYSTDIESLEAIVDDHEIIPLIIEYRKVHKLNSTYVVGLMRAADKSTNRVHTSFKQTVTATGRISSIEPNLQNIPIRTDMGRELRKAFITSNNDYLLVGADYSQIELRVLAHISNDSVLIDSFNKGEDIHTRTASEVFDVSIGEVTEKMRSSAKAVNFGIVYGVSDFGLARNIGISRKEAKEYIERYFARYTGVSKYMEEVVEQGKQDKFVTTIFGRRRYIPELASSNYNVRSFGKRIALNTPIQGSAADIIKIAMINVSNSLRDNGLSSKLILQVHDELILECPKNEIDLASKILKDSMENVVKLDVPLTVDVKCGESWYDTK